jgi:DNA mismatch repair protein MSH5
MQILLKEGTNSRLEERITFLYKLRYGLELTSHAAQCELLCGIPQKIVERAEYIAQLSRDHNLQELQMRIQDGMQEDVQESDQDLRQAEELARAFVQWNIAEDQDLAASYGERPSLDPRVKLQVLING